MVRQYAGAAMRLIRLINLYDVSSTADCPQIRKWPTAFTPVAGRGGLCRNAKASDGRTSPPAPARYNVARARAGRLRRRHRHHEADRPLRPALCAPIAAALYGSGISKRRGIPSPRVDGWCMIGTTMLSLVPHAALDELAECAGVGQQILGYARRIIRSSTQTQNRYLTQNVI